ncbi:MAG: hypothetical protein PVG51_13505 [Desulfosarcina sp.]|jgi:hypothetical protein
MTRDKVNGQRLIGLFLVGVLLFNFPLLYLFNQPLLIVGIPILYLYLFTAWALIIVLMLVISRTKAEKTLPDHST